MTLHLAKKLEPSARSRSRWLRRDMSFHSCLKPASTTSSAAASLLARFSSLSLNFERWLNENQLLHMLCSKRIISVSRLSISAFTSSTFLVANFIRSLKALCSEERKVLVPSSWLLLALRKAGLGSGEASCSFVVEPAAWNSSIRTFLFLRQCVMGSATMWRKGSSACVAEFPMMKSIASFLSSSLVALWMIGASSMSLSAPARGTSILCSMAKE
mmetsp:Transcript_22905/g.51605  ORF Transcript_22905/g.51605 Transcript_22905/m.51605 type:complete len:215 (-) Transcript_22905:24-668(-)